MHRIQQKSDDERPELPEKLKRKMQRVAPSSLQIYVLHNQRMYCASVSALDVANELSNGRATLTIYARPVTEESDDSEHGPSVKLDGQGFLINVTPSDARAALMSEHLETSAPVSSHPLPSSASLINARTATMPTNTVSESADGKNKLEEVADAVANDELEQIIQEGLESGDNPIVGLLFGGMMRNDTPALALRLHVALYQAHPVVVGNFVRWQQQNRILPRNKLLALWQLSTISSNTVVKLLVLPLLLLLLLATWTIVYSRFAMVRHATTEVQTALVNLMPEAAQQWIGEHWEAAAQAVPAWLLESIQAVAPRYLLAMFLLLPLLGLLLTRSARIMHWWLHSFSLRSVGGTIYGLTLGGCATLSGKEWNKICDEVAQRPDLTQGVRNSGWASEDVQERYWIGAGKVEKEARKRIKASSEWRSKLDIDSILDAKQPHFHLLKKVFPHGVLCWSKSGYPVFAMKLGPLKKRFSELEEAGVGDDELVKHVAFIYEYAWQLVDERELPGGMFINILDMEGLSVWDLQSKAMKLAKLCSKVSEKHYPDRLHRALMVNAPGSVHHMWGMVKPMLDKNAQDRTSVYTKSQTHKGLLEELEEDDIPEEWGGKRKDFFYGHKDEVALFKRAAKNNGQNISELAIKDMFKPPENE